MTTTLPIIRGNPALTKTGRVRPGTYYLSEPIVLDGRSLRGRAGPVTLIAGDFDAVQIVGEGSVLAGVTIIGGLSAVVCEQGARSYVVEYVQTVNSGGRDLQIGAAWPVLFVKGGARGLVDSCFVIGGQDNGLQIEGVGGVTVRNCAFAGPFGNKAIDSTHNEPRNVLLVHNTIVDEHGYGIGLFGWRDGRDLVCANNLVIVPPSPPGASHYAIAAPNGGTLAHNQGFEDVDAISCRSWRPADWYDLRLRRRLRALIADADYFVRFDALGVERDRQLGSFVGAVA